MKERLWETFIHFCWWGVIHRTLYPCLELLEVLMIIMSFTIETLYPLQNTSSNLTIPSDFSNNLSFFWDEAYARDETKLHQYGHVIRGRP